MKKKFKESELNDLKSRLEAQWIKNIGSPKGFAETWQVVNDAARYSFNACLAEDTIIQKPYRDNLSIGEMYKIKHDKDYAESIGCLDLHNEYNANGYGCALSMFEGKNNHHHIEPNTIVNIYYSGKGDIYRVKTGTTGAYIDCTMNHKFPTPKGKKLLSELSVGDYLFEKYKREVILSEITSIEFLRHDDVYDVEMADPAHTIVSQSGLVVSNSHSLSVAIDSLYGAYLKSHYPLEYYTVVLNLYSDDTARTMELIAELPYFGIKINPIQFGKSLSNYVSDKDTMSIYKGIASIKYCNDTIAEELMTVYENTKGKDFIDVLDAISQTSINSNQLDILIGLNFFSAYGKSKKLMTFVKVFNGIKKNAKTLLPSFRTCKQISKVKIDSYSEYGITEFLIKKYSSKETASQYREIDNIGLLKEVFNNIPNKDMTVIESIKFEKEYLDYVEYTNSKVPKTFYVVMDMKFYSDKNKPYLVLRNINTGEEMKTKIKNRNTFQSNPFGVFSVLSINGFTWDFKKKNVDGKWISLDEREPILEKYEVVKG